MLGRSSILDERMNSSVTYRFLMSVLKYLKKIALKLRTDVAESSTFMLGVLFVHVHALRSTIYYACKKLQMYRIPVIKWPRA